MQGTKTPTWFLIVSIILLIWNLMGVFAFFNHLLMDAEAINALPEAEQNLYAKYPLWTEIAYALAVFGGAIGCLGLVLKQKWAKPVLIISLLGVIVQMYHSLFIAKATEVYGPGAIAMPIMVTLFAVFLVWFANYAIKRGWLK
ncbi:hypothetical protein [Mesonia aquimarina]|uniref:hypothetical protein n=1 Tax=Mesonia aquimarina TaxID=1504967 RepID=UPI000EF564E7|nr:hypothetical protein [Mesonia aquimarina]